MGTSKVEIGTGKPAQGVTFGLRVRTGGMLAAKCGTVVGFKPIDLVVFEADGTRSTSPGGETYVVRMDDGREMVTDLRQRCWRLA